MATILRENMRDVLFLDIFNQANFKYTQKKFSNYDIILGLWRVLRSVF